jgi:hypothetical protein
MKQLISHHGDLLLLGLQNVALLMNRNMSSSSSSSSAFLELSKLTRDDTATEPLQKDQPDLNDVTAVAVTSFVVPGTLKSTTFCAVARYDKSLSIFTFHNEDYWGIDSSSSTPTDSCSPTKLLPSMVYHSPKRVSCLTFAKLPVGPASTCDETIQVLISGDLVGDSYAYNVMEKGQKLLLGHTASMLTGVAMLQGEQQYCIATADRDEKIRISRFPESYIVEGYLLGHTKFVTAIDAVSTKKVILLVSCGGDKMVRLWNCTTMKELCSISTADVNSIPSDVAISDSGRTVAVLFDEIKVLKYYQVLNDQEDKYKMIASQTIECPHVPLVLSFDQSHDRWLILMREPGCIMYVEVDEKLGCVTTGSMVQDGVLLESVRALVAKRCISLPNSILEKDNQRNPVLQKEVETRGASAEEVPWKRPERIATAKEKQRNRRRNRREKEKKKQKRTKRIDVTSKETTFP